MRFKVLAFAILCCLVGFTLPAKAHGKVYEKSDIFANLGAGDKIAIVLFHFGTTHDDTRAVTLDAINKRVKAAFPGVEVREAYGSRIVIKRLGDRGIIKHNPEQVLRELKAEGYTHILIQPTAIIDGVEIEALTEEVEAMRPAFKEIRVGTSLLFTPENYEDLIEVITKDSDPSYAHLWVGHGTYDVSTAQYAMLDYMFKDKGYENHFVGCVEGYPFYEQVLRQLQASGLKKVKLHPFLIVGGEHAKNDIAQDWKEKLEAAGFTVEADTSGLGERPDIQELYVKSLKFYAKHRRMDIKEKKKIYEVTGEKMTEIDE